MGLTRITSDGITDAAIVNADINASAAIAGTKIDPDFGSQHITTTGIVTSKDLILSDGSPSVTFTDNNNNPDYKIVANDGKFTIEDTTNSADRFVINDNGTGYFVNNFQIGAATTSPGATLHIKTSFPSLKIDSGGHASDSYVRMIAGSSQNSRVEFGDSDDDDIGMIDYDHANNSMAFKTNTSERTRIDSDGRLLIGTSSSRNVGGSTTNSKLQIEGTSTNTSSMSLVNNENSTAAPFVFFGKTRGNSAGESGIVQNGDTLGGLSFIGADSVDTNNRTAEITAVVNGSPANNTIPTDLTFSTSTANAGQLAERMRVKSDGSVGIGHNDPGQLLSLKVGSGQQCQQSFTSATDQSCAIYFGDTDSVNRSVIVHDNANDSLAFNTAATERIRIDNSGNVGINESSPSSELVVKANDSNESAIQILAGGNGKESQLFFAAPDDADVGSIKYDHNGDVMKFTVAAGERMRLTDSGNFFHGRTSNIVCNSVNTSNNFEQIDSFTWTLGLHADQAHKIGLAILYSSTNNNHDFIRCHVSGSGGRFVVESDGDCFNQNGTYSSLSDVSLKENIVDAKSQWNDIKNIKVRNFNFKESTDRPTHTQIGLVAQELETVCPNLVKKSEEGLKTVANSVLYMKAIKCLQEAMAKIETLETEVAALKAG